MLFAAPGDAVWDMLAQLHTAAESAGVLAGSFDADASQIRADLEPVIAELLDIGALCRV